ncbi:Flp family type IVb pilin [Sinorhizobium meliloti]|uniref:Flp/Fap pilin component n=2 Tax=Sinorhizobium TaxID=28105 RepID=H0G9R9_RHIML|nr:MULTISPECIES: Flp family type IVb pilin [Sinorhizobium]EHK73953.1 Flp/Fap pilin component [Sinorhizobium meliloti CCNWSX0020]MCM5693478.1 Flp family type IVb pilin [Sinorhizobium meliloti]MDE3811963.1 Flp family type IVb pilin [Sinorhizobium meliloti]MDE3826788.1 Flp family type IVb pilin [Sinorhizobium meliloti]MDW9353925.1 Flp family type IVb pilin [Sinorhizobium meliloti]
MKTIFARLMKDESGATAIEYGLIAALISVALIGGAQALGGKLNTQFTNLGSYLDVTQKSGGTPPAAPSE